MSLYAEFRRRVPTLMRCLENARANGRFAHSFLVCCSDPEVRRDFAVVLAELAGCRGAAAGVPDPDCDYCRRLEAGTYPEFHTLSPMGKMYFIKVGDRVNPEPNTLRSFLNRFDFTATAAAPRKIGVIYEADRMNDEAQNALLKTLEEPPPDTTLILCTANPASLLPTTRSRCQIVKLPDNGCRFDFDGAPRLFKALFDCCFSSDRDLVTAEAAVQSILEISGGLSAVAEAAADEEFASEMELVGQLDDSAMLKRLAVRRDDAAKGEYMRQRGRFVSAIYTFCAQLYLLSCGVAFADLPNPEVFDGLRPPENITLRQGEFVLREAEELEHTLLFNVSEELALRSFAVNLALFAG
jgi:DNA polymerase-3 subunit delta'